MDFGYNSEGKGGHEQIVIGLLCSKEGCPVGVGGLGNTKDSSTVMAKIADLREQHDFRNIIFGKDQGTIFSSKIDHLKTSAPELPKNSFPAAN